MQQPTLDEEISLWAAGYQVVAGLDEAGRGAWAGPVVAAAVALPADPAIGSLLRGVADSKQLSPAQRAAVYPTIMTCAVGIGVGVISAERIDAIGILPATHEAMAAALAGLPVPPRFLLLDYVRLAGVPLPQRAFVKGDRRVLSIAAASIIAKVARDRLMIELARSYPGYGFDRHKGYGTADHQAALARFGPCPEHRLSFQPIRGRQPALFADQERLP